MQFLTLAMILCVTCTEFLVNLGFLPQLFKYLPELFTALFLIYIVVAGVAHRFQSIHPKYWLAFGSLFIVIISGALANHVEVGPIVAGARALMKAAPLFFVAAVYPFNERQIRLQLLLVAGIALIQVPLAIAQRLWVTSQGRQTGDLITGTLRISSILSIFQICTVCVLVALLVRKRLSRSAFIFLFLLILIPTTINETKGTLFLLPIGLLAAVLVAAEPGRRLQIALWSTILLVGFGTLFIPIYNSMRGENKTRLEQILTQDSLEERMYKNAQVGTYGEYSVGRGDALAVSIKEIAKDPARLVFGLGIGNASMSSLSPTFTGKYAVRLDKFTFLSLSLFLLEIGTLGTAIVLILHWLILRDAQFLAHRHAGFMGAVSAGWVGVTVVMTIALAYKAIHTFESLSYLFWYFSGLVASQRMRLEKLPSRKPYESHSRSLQIRNVRGQPA